MRRRIVAYALLVAMSLLLVATSNVSQVQELRRGVNYALAPIQETLAGGARAVSSMFAAVTEIDQLRRENGAFEARIAQLEEQIAGLEVLRGENERLSDLLGTRKSLKFRTVAAFVVQRQSSQFERVVTLDHGAESGIELNDAVLSPGGSLAGVITEVGQGYAYARLLNDTRSLVIGMDERTRATGEVIGNLSRPLTFDKVPATERLDIGDKIVTAGQLVERVPSLLPRGLLIGTIVDRDDSSAGFIKTALVQPAADLDHLEAVLVITDFETPRLPGQATPQPDQGMQPVASAEPRPTKRPKADRAGTP